jgi:hypothetical protein
MVIDGNTKINVPIFRRFYINSRMQLVASPCLSVCPQVPERFKSGRDLETFVLGNFTKSVEKLQMWSISDINCRYVT